MVETYKRPLRNNHDYTLESSNNCGNSYPDNCLDTYYSAESFNWYSLDRLKHSCTPESFQSLFMIAASSGDSSPSSALPIKANNCLASS